VPEKRPVKKHPKDHESKPKLTTPFNEQAYLSGQISILGDPNHKAALRKMTDFFNNLHRWYGIVC